jgi:hypothetical protein
MNKGRKETITIRIISATFVVAALAVFKPFGLEDGLWLTYVHLFVMGVLGFCICMVTDGILKYVIKKPRSYDKGVSYIIRRNLWFQIINTPLVALGVCLYRHFVMSDRIGGNLLSWTNYLETLVIIAFCSFAIGLYWRFKFRSRYLAIELKETQHLNEQLKKWEQRAKDERQENAQHLDTSLTLTGTTSDTIQLQIPDLLYIEAVGNYVKVFHLHDGQVQTDMLRATSKQIEEELQAYPMIVRCHRAFLVNLGQVDQIVSHSGSMQLIIKHSHESIPVSRSNMAQVKDAVKGSKLL